MFSVALIFAPQSLLFRVLHHINTVRGTFLIVIFIWKIMFWMPDLRRRSLCKPMKFMKPIQRTSRHSTTDSGDGILCLEHWGWADTMQNWTKEERFLLRCIRRDSTLKTYMGLLDQDVSNDVN